MCVFLDGDPHRPGGDRRSRRGKAVDNLFLDDDLTACKSSTRNSISSTRNHILTDDDLALGAVVKGAPREIAVAFDDPQTRVRNQCLELGGEELALGELDD